MLFLKKIDYSIYFSASYTEELFDPSPRLRRIIGPFRLMCI